MTAGNVRAVAVVTEVLNNRTTTDSLTVAVRFQKRPTA
jgi:hypothetical protein